MFKCKLLLIGVSVSCLISCGTLTRSPLTEVSEAYTLRYKDESKLSRQLVFQGSELAIIVGEYDLNVLSLINFDYKKVLTTGQFNPIKKLQILDDDALVITFDSVLLLDSNSWVVKKVYQERTDGYTRLSNSGELISFENKVLNVYTGESEVEFSGHMFSYISKFSPDDRFLIDIGGPFYGPYVLDLSEKEEGRFTEELIERSRKVEFIASDLFLVDGYGTSDFSLFPDPRFTLNLINATTVKIEDRFESSEAVSCWTLFGDQGEIALAFENGDLSILNKELEIIDNYSIGDRADYCVGGKGEELWLGTWSSGVIHVDLNDKSMSKPMDLNNRVFDLAVSEDEKFIGVIQEGVNTNIVSIYEIPDKKAVD
jgi:hypothetical protein